MTPLCRSLLLGVVLCAASATAKEGIVEKVAVRHRLYSVARRFEVGANVGFTLFSRLTDTYVFNLAAGYNVAEWFAVELRGGYAYSRHTALADQIQAAFPKNTSIAKANDAADLWEMTGHGVVGARFQPIYGKLNLMSEVPIHFQLYLWAGAGVAGLKRQSVVLCTERTADGCNAFYTQNKISPLVSLALGFRFFLPLQGHGLRLEFRDWSYLDSYFVGVSRTAPNNDPTAGGKLSPDAFATNVLQIDLGYTFVF